MVSTSFRSVFALAIYNARTTAKMPCHGLTDKSEDLVTGKERLTIGKCVAVTRHHAFDHRLLGEMLENALA